MKTPLLQDLHARLEDAVLAMDAEGAPHADLPFAEGGGAWLPPAFARRLLGYLRSRAARRGRGPLAAKELS